MTLGDIGPNSFLREIEEFLHRQIPLSRSMGVQVESHDEDQLALTAPLALNHNHLGTAFGGSLSALATLAGYGLLWTQLEDKSAHIVIRESQIVYLHPVTSQLRMTCKNPESSSLAAFKETFRIKGRARIRLEVTAVEEGRVCVVYKGTYVAIC